MADKQVQITGTPDNRSDLSGIVFVAIDPVTNTVIDWSLTDVNGIAVIDDGGIVSALYVDGEVGWSAAVSDLSAAFPAGAPDAPSNLTIGNTQESPYVLAFEDHFDTPGPNGGADYYHPTENPDAFWLSHGIRRLHNRNRGEAYYWDPYHAGFQNSNDYEALGFNPTSISNSILTITASQEPQLEIYTNAGDDPDGTFQEWASGKIASKRSFAMLYGVWEARLRTPLGDGMWPAFWSSTIAEDWPIGGEIDFEFYGDGDFKAGVIYDGPNFTDDRRPDVNDADQWHIYRIEWDPNEVRFMRRPSETDPWTTYYTATGTQNDSPSDLVWPHHVMINLALARDWDGTPAVADGPHTMDIDYIRAYRRAGDSVVNAIGSVPDITTRVGQQINATLPDYSTLFDGGDNEVVTAFKYDVYLDPNIENSATVEMPTGLSYDAGTRTISGSLSHPGRTEMQVIAWDSGGGVAGLVNFFIHVAPTSTAIGSQTTTAGASFSYDASQNFDSGLNASPTFSLETAPAWLSIDADTGVISGTAPDPLSPPYDVTVRCIGSGGTTTDDSFQIISA